MLDQQVNFAKTKYPTLQYANYQLNIEFNEKQKNKFIIQFNSNFPNQAPAIYLQTPQGPTGFTPPMVKFWSFYYTVSDLLDHLYEYSKMPQPSTFSLSDKEVHDALTKLPPMQRADPTLRTNALKQIPTIVKAEKEAAATEQKTAQLKSSMAKNQQEIQRLIQESYNVANQTNQLQTRMAQMSQQGPQLQQKALKQKIKTLRELSKKFEKSAQKDLEAFQNGTITLSQFMDSYNRNKQEAIKNKLIAEKLERKGQ